MPNWHQTSSMWSCIRDLIYDPEPKGTQTVDSESHSNWAESFCVLEYSLRLQGARFPPGMTNWVLQMCIFVVKAHSRRLGIWMLSTITCITVCHRWVTSLQLQFGWLPCFHFSWNVAFSSCKDDDLSTQAVAFILSLDELKTHRCVSLFAPWKLTFGDRSATPSPPDTGRMCCAPRYFWLRFIPISSHSRSDAFSCERVARDTLHSDAGNQMMLMKQRGLQRLGPRSGPP